MRRLYKSASGADSSSRNEDKIWVEACERGWKSLSRYGSVVVATGGLLLVGLVVMLMVLDNCWFIPWLMPLRAVVDDEAIMVAFFLCVCGSLSSVSLFEEKNGAL